MTTIGHHNTRKLNPFPRAKEMTESRSTNESTQTHKILHHILPLRAIAASLVLNLMLLTAFKALTHQT